MPRGVYERKPKVQEGEPMRIWISLPQDGVALKLLVGQQTNPSHVMGTLLVSQRGLKYLRSNAKVKPDRELTWDKLERLMQSGLL